MWGLAVNDASSRTAIDTDTLGRIEWNRLIPALGQLVKPGKALGMKMGYFVVPGVGKPVTVVRKHDRCPVSRCGQAKTTLYAY
jgi:hypothetical protein